jgi:hypothetical protein
LAGNTDATRKRGTVKIYSAARHLCCGAVTVLGVCVALLIWPSTQMVVTFVLIGFGAAFVRHLILLGRSKASASSSFNWKASARPAARAGLVGVALGGVAEISIGLALLLALIAIATSPRFVATLRSRIPQKPKSIPAEPLFPAYAGEAHLQEVAREVDHACLHSLSNAELCVAWRRSYCTLIVTSSVPLRAAVVASRQAYLDEMERRDPRGLTAWLAAGARAASGPERYLDDAHG